MTELRVLDTEREQCIRNSIETLESALEEARAGRVVAVAIAVLRPKGEINVGHSDTADVGRLLGAISLLQWRLLNNLERQR